MLNHTTKIIAACVLTSLSQASTAKTTPLSLEKLEQSILQHEASCRNASVGISTNFGAQGSGVIVSKDGVILTAAHVVERLGSNFTAILADGRRVQCVALLVNQKTDSAIAKITDKAPKKGWDFRPIRTKPDLKQGDWCTVISNSGGIQLNRPAPLRVGRIIDNDKTKVANTLVSDCTVISGDSGGPLFDLNGDIAAINSSVGPNSSLENMHISSRTFISQWGDYLLRGKALPTPQEAKNADKSEREAAGLSTSTLPKAVLKKVKEALSKKWPELNDEALNALISNATLDKGQLKISSTPALIAKLKKLGFDPKKYGLVLKKGTTEKAKPEKEKAQPKKAEPKPKKKETAKTPLTIEQKLKKAYGDLPAEAIEILKKSSSIKEDGSTQVNLSKESRKRLNELGINLTDLKKEKELLKRFGKIPENAMTLLKSLLHETETGYNLAVTPEDVQTLKKMGVDLMKNQLAAPNNKNQITQILTAQFKKQYGEDIPQEALDILLDAAKFDSTTGHVAMQLDGAQYNKLKELGISLDLDNKDYETVASLYGDSAPDIISQLPALDNAISVSQNGKHLGLATPIKQNGLLLCKASQLDGDLNVTISMSGVILQATVLSRDLQTDLALISVKAKLHVTEWTEKSTTLGRLLAVITEDQPMLATVSVNPRLIPTKTRGIGNGNKVILGISAAESKKEGALVGKTYPDTPAKKAGLKSGDLIIAVGDTKIKNFKQLSKVIGKFSAGDKVTLTTIREGKEHKIPLHLESSAKSNIFSTDAINTAAQKLSSNAGNLSKRRVSFPECFSHDAIMWDEDCGGPVYTIDGKLAGINIARFSRTTNYALTQQSVEVAIARLLKSSKQ